jgi:hypothetical protein
MSLPPIVFMDTSYAIAWLSQRDDDLVPARALAETLAKARTMGISHPFSGNGQ